MLCEGSAIYDWTSEEGRRMSNKLISNLNIFVFVEGPWFLLEKPAITNHMFFEVHLVYRFHEQNFLIEFFSMFNTYHTQIWSIKIGMRMKETDFCCVAIYTNMAMCEINMYCS